LLEGLEHHVEMGERVELRGARMIPDEVGVFERFEGGAAPRLQLSRRAVDRFVKVRVGDGSAHALGERRQRMRGWRRAHVELPAPPFRSSATWHARTFMPRRRMPPARWKRQPESQLTTTSAPDRSSAKHLRSSIAPLIAGCFTLNIPPK